MTDRSSAQSLRRAAIVVLAVGAAVQAWAVGDRVAQLAWLSYKFSHVETISAGREAFIAFSVASLLGAGCAALASRGVQGRWRHVALFVAASYAVAWFVWSALAASGLAPFVR